MLQPERVARGPGGETTPKRPPQPRETSTGAELHGADDRGDIQGLVLHTYSAFKVASFLFLRIENRRQCKQWLARHCGEVTDSRRTASKPEHAVNIAFTQAGLARLGLNKDALATFPTEFQRGMPARMTALGGKAEDTREWQFGSGSRYVHLLLMLYARSEEELGLLVHGQLEQSGTKTIYHQQARRLLKGKASYEPFGFRDGLSQPRIAHFPPELPKPERDYEDPIATGEFILGYKNERGFLPLSPSVPARLDPEQHLVLADESETRRDLGRHGTYLVVQKLEQDVKGFKRFIQAQARALQPGSHLSQEELEEWLKAKLVGRWSNGELIREGTMAAPRTQGSANVDNNFKYMAHDAQGFGCPVTSHIRRCNPRDSLAPSGKQPGDKPRSAAQDAEESLKLVRRHRLIRRGIPYKNKGTGEEGDSEGTLFIAINANIQQQFEFIQQGWLNNGKFGGMGEQKDPLVGNTDGSGSFTIPGKPVRQCLRHLPSFVTLKGGAYFFLPSKSALRFLAALPG